jgi:hypothetical protein
MVKNCMDTMVIREARGTQESVRTVLPEDSDKALKSLLPHVFLIKGA